jgi:hypothetical protein
MNTGYEKKDIIFNYGLLDKNNNYITDTKSKNTYINKNENNIKISEIICPCKIKLNLFGRK